MGSTAKSRIKWACPKCGADVGAHGKGGEEKCTDSRYGSSLCRGLICECDQNTEAEHGEVFTDPCKQANCYHCGWGGTMPQKPKGILPWEKKALDAGWAPPEGWNKGC